MSPDPTSIFKDPQTPSPIVEQERQEREEASHKTPPKLIPTDVTPCLDPANLADNNPGLMPEMLNSGENLRGDLKKDE